MASAGNDQAKTNVHSANTIGRNIIHVRRISTTYEVRGLVEIISSHDTAAVGSGAVVNQVVQQYNDFGMLVREYQEHSGVKNMDTPHVGYHFDESAADGEFIKGLCATALRYPNGRLLHYAFSTPGQCRRCDQSA